MSPVGVCIMDRPNPVLSQSSIFGFCPKNRTLRQNPAQTRYQAHWKVDGRTGEWLHFGVAYGRRPRLHLTMFTAAMRLRPHWTVPLFRPVFLHDWLVTERHVLF